LRIEPAPAHQDARYLAALGSCFDGWGGQAEFDWYFRRPFAGRVADRFVVSDEDSWIAGSAVSWRRLAEVDGTARPVGIMTGSWTLPEARGRGCFKAIIEHSRELCLERGADWLLAFVTQDNASRRLLERAGSMMIPTDYLWSVEGAEPPATGSAAEARRVEPSPTLVDALQRRHQALGQGHVRFLYDDPATWAGQLVQRTLPTDLLEVDELGAIVVERHPVFDRVLTTLPLHPEARLPLIRAAWARALRAGRRFFAFTSRPGDAAALRESCGLGGTAGFITLLPAAAPAPDFGAPWSVESGDRV
jgi:GNAT superfamily N-acetyltransferase